MLFTEPDLPKDIHGNLRRRGHRTRVFPYVFTAVQAVQRKGPITLGSSDPRKQGKPAGQ
jgi:gamma-glutamyltranspeptidase